MGLITIVSMTGTYFIATRYTEEPEIAALIVIAVTVLFVIVGNLLVTGFNRIAEAHRMKSEFISIASHQLRSPLSIFKWTVDVLEREVKKGERPPAGGETPATQESSPERLTNFIHTLSQATEHMIRLVNSLLEVSRIEADRLVLQKEPLSLTDLTKTVLENYKSYAKASNVALVLHAPADIPRVVGDRDHVLMAIQNLVDNAVRYSANGGTATITLSQKDSFAHFRIEDQGMGIAVQEKKNVFKKFFRASNGLKYQTEGTGIGLYIAKAIIDGLGGTIGFSSQEGKGSVFWFMLPIAVNQ